MKTKPLIPILLCLLILLLVGMSCALAEESGSVARVGEVEYDTLQAAIDDVSDGSEVLLLQDTTESIDTKGRSFTLDMDNYTLTAASGRRAYTQIGGVVTVKNGIITGGSTTENGGGMYVNNGTLNVTSVSITGNTAAGSGGGIYVNNENNVYSLNLNSVSFTNNIAPSGTGGLHISGNTTFQIVRCEFQGNKGETGALYANADSNSYLQYCTLKENVGTKYAGAITEKMHGKWLTLYSTVIMNNIGWKAGGLYGQYEAGYHYGINLVAGNIVCNNMSTDGNRGNDIAIDKNKYSIIKAANSMGISNEPFGYSDLTFSDYVWLGGTKSPTLDNGIPQNSTYYLAPTSLYFTASIPDAMPSGVFVDGANGDDSYDGLTMGTPVKTFAKAKEVLAANTGASAIYVLGKITVTDTQEWSLTDGKSLIRHPNYKGALVEVSGNLTLKDIVLDGNGNNVSASSAMVRVTDKGTLNIADGTVLQNNWHDSIGQGETYVYAGGAVFSMGGNVCLNGGVIQNNYCWFGGGIQMWGGTLTMNGGSIQNNSVQNTINHKPFGGGVSLMHGAQMVMNGGEISGNTSGDTGGGIGVGGINSGTIDRVNHATLTMNGGTVKNNISEWEGGGIYIQSEAIGFIYGDVISGNQSNAGHFGGGGIYVNGARKDTDGESFDQGELYLQNVIITKNSAQRAGGGLAGCGSSTTNIYVGNGGAIYGNQDGEGAQQIYIDGGLVTLEFGSSPYAVISGYMLDGTPYNWTDRNGKLIPLDILSRIGSTYHFNNDHTEDKTGLGAVLITGNGAVTRGGGIGSNGYVQIGLVPTEGAWTPEATKTLIGRDMAEQEFTFDVKDENGNVVSTGYNLAAANGQPAQIIFTPISFDGQAIGTQLTYTIAEVQTSLPAYVTGDANSFTVDVTVIEGPDGKLTGAVSSESPAVAFQNVYTPMEGAWTPLGIKTLTGRDMAQNEFVFVVTENGNVVSTGYNVAAKDGEPAQILFTPISFVGDIAGTTHTYVITEVLDNLPAGVTGDPSSYTVEVTVTEGADGELTGMVNSASPAVSFHNIYVPSEGEWTPEGTKTLIGRDMIQGEFRFEVHENGRLVSNGYAQAAGDSEAARIFFTPISLNGEAVGTKHTYVITERQDAMPMDITGDSRSYTVEVTVSRGADGRLIGEVSASSPEVHFENCFDPPVPNLPQTGDNSHIALWGVLLALSASCMFVILNRRRLGGER